MYLQIVLKPKPLYYDPALLERWKQGDRDYCADSYCRKLGGSYGFGEYIVGRHFESQGYKWIHHDFDIFGTNKPGKYPRSEKLLLEFFGSERLEVARSLHKTLWPFRQPGKVPIETPDLLVYKTDASELRFAESKRSDTGDQLNERQVIGLALIAAVFRCPVELFIVAPEGSTPRLDPEVFSFPGFSGRQLTEPLDD